MKKSHYVFIGICIVWVLAKIIIAYSGSVKLEAYTSTILGEITGSLIYPAIGYGIYLLIEWLVRKPKSKKAI